MFSILITFRLDYVLMILGENWHSSLFGLKGIVRKKWNGSINRSIIGRGIIRLSQSPSLLFSGSGSWPQRSGSLARFLRRKHKKSTPWASCSWKIWARLVGKCWATFEGCFKIYFNSEKEKWGSFPSHWIATPFPQEEIGKEEPFPFFYLGGGGGCTQASINLYS